MEKKKIIDPETGKEIWVLVDAEGNIIEKNVPAPEETLTEAQRKELELERQKAEKEKFEVFQQTTLTEVNTLKETINTLSETMAKLMQTITAPQKTQDQNQEPTEPQEKIVYVADPNMEQANKVLAQKAKEFEEYKQMQQNKDFIKSQIEAKPFMKDLVEKLGIKTQADYIRIAIPLEEREEENAKIKEQLKSNQNRNPINEYGIGMFGVSTSESALDKINKEAQAEADSFLSRLLV